MNGRSCVRVEVQNPNLNTHEYRQKPKKSRKVKYEKPSSARIDLWLDGATQIAPSGIKLSLHRHQFRRYRPIRQEIILRDHRPKYNRLSGMLYSHIVNTAYSPHIRFRTRLLRHQQYFTRS